MSDNVIPFIPVITKPPAPRCPSCGEPVPDGKMTAICPACVEAKSEVAYRQYQYQYGDQIAADRATLTVVYIPGGVADRTPLWHLQRFEDIRHAFCGLKLRAGLRRDQLVYSKLIRTTPQLCPACAEELDKVIHAAL